MAMDESALSELLAGAGLDLGAAVTPSDYAAGPGGSDMDDYEAGLRCQDVNSGVRTFDAASSRLTPLKRTRIVGMAADLAGLVREMPLISNVEALEAVAAAELDIPSTSFDGVLDLLEQAELVELTRNPRGAVTGLTTQVPYYQGLYEVLGGVWRERGPSQLEEEMVAVVHRLAAGPVPLDALTQTIDIEQSDVGRVLDLGAETNLILSVSGVDGKVLYSPFSAFENPTLLSALAEQHGNDRMLEEFDAVRNRQGLAVQPETYPLLHDAIGRGLLMAPAVELPTGELQPFATLPYTLDRELLVGQKPVLDKALAVLACIRCGEEFGGYSDLPSALHAIDKLLREGELKAHSSSERQYRLMRNKGIIAYGQDPMPWGSWVVPKLINTPDNRRALKIAKELIQLGEPTSGRQSEQARDALSTDSRYLTPIKAAAISRKRLEQPESEFGPLIAGLMGYGAP